jgi:hypothetical protein
MGANVELDIFLKKEGFSLQPILSLLKMEGLYIHIQEIRVFDDWSYTNDMNIDTSSIDINTSNIFLEKFTLIHFIINDDWKCVLITSFTEDAFIDLSFGLSIEDLSRTYGDINAALLLFYNSILNSININVNTINIKDTFVAASMGVEYSVHFNKNIRQMIEDDNGVEIWILPKDIGRNISLKNFLKEEKSNVTAFTRY